MKDLDYYRIRESGLSFDAAARSSFSVTIVLGQSAISTASGQSIALNLLNFVLRFVTNVLIVAPTLAEPVRVRFPFSGPDLSSAVQELIKVCDPRAHVRVVERAEAVGSRIEGDFCIGIGADADPRCDVYVSAEGYMAISSSTPIPVNPTDKVLVGAGLAALIGAANVARHMNGQESICTKVSGWNFAEGIDAGIGPDEWAPLDIGRARIIGAGAVASALVYWLYQWGEKSSWEIVDADVVKLKNIAKTIAYSTGDAYEIGKENHKKVDVLKSFLADVSVFDNWYDEWDAQGRPQPDVFVPLANERGVRARVASESNTVVLHATTSTEWESFVHRHIAGPDDCIACRLPDRTPIAMACSTGKFGKGTEESPSRDSSLPFVGGAGGLMLAVVLKRLELGKLNELRWNGCAWLWRTEHKFARFRQYKCEPGCGTFLPAAIRRAVNAGGRWSHLDSDTE